jgi:hypothetical protein
MVTAAWRRAFVCSLFVAPVVLLGSGCRTADGWRAPWSGWGWGGASSPNATALNISKPSTQAPSPSNTPGQPTRGLAASGGANAPGAGGVAPANGVAGYPATAQADAYPAQNVATWQPGASAGGQVAPAGGLQVGPYGMQSNPPASGYGGNAQPRGPAAGPAGYGGAPRSNVGGAAATTGPAGSREDYRTADQGAAGPYRGGAAPSTAPAAVPVENPETNSVYGGGEGPATATEPSVYGSTEETSPAEGANANPTGPYSNTESAAESPRSYGPPNTVAPGARPATSPPPTSGATRPALPSSLSNAGGYRPGSTGGFGSRNGGYEQPQNAAVPESDPASSPMYR